MLYDLDVEHLQISDILKFLGVPRSVFLRDEGSLFPALPKNVKGYRYASLAMLCQMYECIWTQKPSEMHIADFLAEVGLQDPEWGSIYIRRLKNQGLLR